MESGFWHPSGVDDDIPRGSTQSDPDTQQLEGSILADAKNNILAGEGRSDDSARWLEVFSTLARRHALSRYYTPDPTKGYYAFDLGTWRFYALNSNCSPVPCAAGSAQEQWLRADLAAYPRTCTAAFMHHPRFSSGFHGSIAWVSALWSALYDHGVDVVLQGHDHGYERFTRLSPTGAIELERGIRSFVVGTGGDNLSVPKTPITGSEARSSTHGVLELTLHAGGYDWAFVPVAGSTFTDAGTDTCGAAPNPGNAAPTVNAGPDQTITLSASATLDGTVNDDGSPAPPSLTTTWSKISGPGTVTFGNGSAVDTTASFSLAGTYVLRLTAFDGALTTFDELTVTVNPAPTGSPLYFSLRAAGTVGGVAAANEDILFFDGGFSLAFDGSDVGLTSLRIDAFSWLDADSLLLSFDAAGSVPGIAGTVDDSDLVRFDASSLGPTTNGTFQIYFDGSDVGLTADAHDLDAVEPLADGRILVSTTGSASPSGASARDEDLIAFTPTSLGDLTAGSFSLYFDGSEVGLGDADEDVDAAALDASERIYLSTTAVFAVPGVSGEDEDVFVFTPTALDPPTTAGSYASTLYFDGSSFGLGANDVFAIDLP